MAGNLKLAAAEWTGLEDPHSRVYMGEGLLPVPEKLAAKP